MSSVVKVGVTVYRFVCLANARHWLIHTLKNNRGRGTVPEDQEEDKVTLPEETETNAFAPAPGQGSSQAGLPSSSASSSHTPAIPQTNRSADIPAQTSSTVSAQLEGENSTSANRSTNRDSLPCSNSGLRSVDASGDGVGENENQETSTAAEGSGGMATDVASGNGTASERDVAEGVDSASRASRRVAAKKWREAEGDVSMEEVMMPPVLPNSTYEKIRLQCRLWRRPEGGLNSKVLSEYLYSMLFYLMRSPSCSLLTLCRHYEALFTPVDIRDMLEILEQVGCVKLMVLKVQGSRSASLFSPRPTLQVMQGPDVLGAGMEELIIEPTVDSSHRLGQFLSFI